jgi:serine/threonine-protein kinase
VHRDIKPANVMIVADGSIKVMDFGIARAMADANATMTQTSAVIGTAQYLSPEQAQGQSVDERSDLYSTGCMLFELLTGRPPFRGESPVSIAYQHVSEPPLPPSRLVEGISEDLDAVVLHSLAKAREARYQSAGEFRSDLQAVRLGRPISDAARGSAALAGAAAGAVVGAAATQVVPALGGDQTQAYAAGPAGPGTETIPGLTDEPEEKKRGAGGWIVLTLVALAALAALVYGLSTYFGEPDAPKIAVPQVVGLPEQTATANLARVGLVADPVTQPSDTVPVDTVISQNPTQGTEVSANTVVRIFVSSGPTAVAVPDLKGLTVAEAKSQLGDLGLEVGTVDEVDDPDTEAGKIIDSNPGAGTSVAPATKINVRVGTGKVPVPNVVGKSQSEAQTTIAAAKLQVETKFKQTNDVAEGTVISQSPKDGTVDIGGTVKITVAQKAAPTVTPTTVTPTPTPTVTPSPTPSPTP